jgi:thiamine-phosphate pyrophosphorylase
VNEDPRQLRLRLADARLMLIFTPELCGERDPATVLAEVLGEIDVIQVRAKSRAIRSVSGIAEDPAAGARATFELACSVLEIVARHPRKPLVLVNDRIDVAMALRERGIAGVHLGRSDLPPREARDLLGEAPLIGLSTHDAIEVVHANEEPIDYVGFGPIYPTSTKSYGEGLGPEAAWVADTGSTVPLFPIGGIDLSRAAEIGTVGRAAVGSGILAAEDPAATAREIARLLGG